MKDKYILTAESVTAGHPDTLKIEYACIEV